MSAFNWTWWRFGWARKDFSEIRGNGGLHTKLFGKLWWLRA